MKNRPLLVLILSVLFIAGCNSQRKIVNKYYLLEIPEKHESPTGNNQAPLDGFCEISPVEVYPAFSSPKIAIRSNSCEIQYYSYHYWAQRPEESFTFMLEDYYSHVALFKGVSTRYWRLDPTYKLFTTIYNLEIIEQEKGATAHLELEFQLTNYSTKKILSKHRADLHQNMETKDLNLFAQAIAEMFYQELKKFSDKVIQDQSTMN
jgi:ABC-type uncharacterized transport system auxiliary subunit